MRKLQHARPMDLEVIQLMMLVIMGYVLSTVVPLSYYAIKIQLNIDENGSKNGQVDEMLYSICSSPIASSSL